MRPGSLGAGECCAVQSLTGLKFEYQQSGLAFNHTHQRSMGSSTDKGVCLDRAC